MDEYITKKIMPIVRLGICAGVCVVTAKLCDSILDDPDTKVVIKKIVKAVKVTKYISGASKLLENDD